MVTSATTVFYDGSEITAEAYSVEIRRGRSRDADEFAPSTGIVQLWNYDRNFDPSFFTTPTYLLMESGDFLLMESGDKILLEQGAQASGDYGVIDLGTDVEIKDGAVTVFDGHVEDTNNVYDRLKRAEATFHLGDTMTSMASSSIQEEWATTDNQLSGARLTELLGRSDIDLSAQIGTIDDGTIRLLGGSVTTADNGTVTREGHVVLVGTNVLQEAQLIARTEHGKLYVDRNGLIQFRDRYTFPSASAAADFDDTNTNFQFNGTGVGVGSELRAWQATVQRQGGEAMTAQSATSPPAKLGRRGLSRLGLLFRGDSQSESLAEHLAEKYAQPEAVITSLEVYLHGLGTSDRATIAALDINDTVTLSWTPTGSGTTITQTLVIEGLTYSADQTGRAVMTFQLSAYPDTNYFTLDTDSLDGGVPLGF